MKFSLTAVVVAFAITPTTLAARVLLAGDSTMAYTSQANMQGWGAPLSKYLSLQVVNLARGGRSARTYTTEGLFRNLVNQVQAGDYVVIEFGHNDGGSPTTSTRAPAPGYGSETVTVTKADGTTEVVQTFTTYIKWAVRDILAKGGKPIVSSTTPNGDAWNADRKEMSPANRFVDLAKRAADAYPGQATYVDHYEFVTRHFEALGYNAVYPDFFPNDHTHTNAAGADVVAQAFISGLSCTSHPLAGFLTTAGRNLTKRCNGTAPPVVNPPTTPPATGTVPKYGQCGGQGYTGPKTCASGLRCTVSNQWYSQCL